MNEAQRKYVHTIAARFAMNHESQKKVNGKGEVEETSILVEKVHPKANPPVPPKGEDIVIPKSLNFP